MRIFWRGITMARCSSPSVGTVAMASARIFERSAAVYEVLSARSAASLRPIRIDVREASPSALQPGLPGGQGGIGWLGGAGDTAAVAGGAGFSYRSSNPGTTP